MERVYLLYMMEVNMRKYGMKVINQKLNLSKEQLKKRKIGIAPKNKGLIQKDQKIGINQRKNLNALELLTTDLMPKILSKQANISIKIQLKRTVRREIYNNSIYNIFDIIMSLTVQLNYILFVH